MRAFPGLIVCEHCDSVYRRRVLAPGEVARCARCDAVLYRARRLGPDHWLALTLAAAIVFVIANVCPVVHIGIQGQHNAATLWESAVVLAQGPIAIIAVPFALSIVVVPGVQIGLLAWVLAHVCAGRRPPGFVLAMRALAALRPWNMVEVGLLGILVAAIKLSHLLQVAPGAGLWATAALVALLPLIAHRDVDRLWELAEPEPSFRVESS
ncbi:MAG: paraquat-inducible protein A [Candidatus Accumulibacter sp.]|jgi:paraquat-inducible protein A|nr:paraquat-inducible protein A [Accumulibacter sp.]